MNNKLISVIVPIYNVEKYLVKCINSIINQTYKNIEIILVDDGSPDNCGTICDYYAKLDSRIKVIHQSNLGLSGARNTGLDMACGELISFVDSDDYLESTFLEELKNNMDTCDSDISMCNFFINYSNRKTINKCSVDQNSINVSGKDKFIALQKENSYLTVCAWNKLYKREIFDNIRYPDGKIYEDLYVICNILDKANKISYLDKPLYNYIYRDNSISHKFTLEHFDKVESFDKKIEFYNNKEYYEFVMEEKNKKIYIIITNLSKMKNCGIKNKDIFNKYYHELIETSKEINWNKASKYTKLFKIFRKKYITFLNIEWSIWNILKNIKYKYTSF